MFPQDVSSLIFVCVWSLAAVAVGLMCGFFMGRMHAVANETRQLRDDRQKTLTALLKLISSTDQLNEDVDEHNLAMESAKKELEEIKSNLAVDDLQTELLSNIARVVKSNRRLENDLVVSKYQLETQAQELDRTRKEARTDALCQIGNRNAVNETLQFMISRYYSERVSFGVMLIDVDHFKRINDTFGHQAGDEVLTSIAIALKACVRPEDFVGRLGGDEFVILLDGMTTQTAKTIGDLIRSTIELHDFSVNNRGQSTVVTLSMGLTVVQPDDDPTTIYSRADRALYQSKSQGRNRLCTILEPPVDETQDSTSGVPQRVQVDSESSYEAFKAALNSDI